MALDEAVPVRRFGRPETCQRAVPSTPEWTPRLFFLPRHEIFMNPASGREGQGVPNRCMGGVSCETTSLLDEDLSDRPDRRMRSASDLAKASRSVRGTDPPADKTNPRPAKQTNRRRVTGKVS